MLDLTFNRPRLLYNLHFIMIIIFIIFIKKDQGKVRKSEKWHGDINVQNCERSKATLS